ncbi:hypothetical protein ES705_37723 [subsurface metagenome]
MKSKTFDLTGDYIELIKLLKKLLIAQSGAHAKLMVEKGEITVNKKVEYRKRAKLRRGDLVETLNYRILIK